MTLNRHRNPSSKHATVPLSSQHLTSNTEGILEYGLLQAQHYHTLVPLAFVIGLPGSNPELSIRPFRTNHRSSFKRLEHLPTAYIPAQYKLWAPPRPTESPEYGRTVGSAVIGVIRRRVGVSQVPPSSTEDVAGISWPWMRLLALVEFRRQRDDNTAYRPWDADTGWCLRILSRGHSRDVCSVALYDTYLALGGLDTNTGIPENASHSSEGTRFSQPSSDHMNGSSDSHEMAFSLLHGHPPLQRPRGRLSYLYRLQQPPKVPRICAHREIIIVLDRNMCSGPGIELESRQDLEGGGRIQQTPPRLLAFLLLLSVGVRNGRKPMSAE
ncbi:hypothetical protein BKA70DRAFT_1567380 [Coprinopsis sp. MPI-PUGE-AT-0042]|nr:hypothetical protein BKA70DRAFT_1567380 [Coprinopsis sp. MPI-PUGE-AT-0042]